MRQITLALGLVLLSAAANAQPPAKTFDMYIVDTEGGHSTLYVSPTGESLLEDAGNPGTRDVDRIMEVIHAAGVKQIDHMIVTHYHVDHVGGIEELAKRIEIKHFIDHGATVEQPEQVRGFQAMYAGLYSKVKHTVAKPGDKIPLGPVDVTVVTSAKEVIKKPLPGGGIPNPACAEYKDRDDSDTQAENKESVGVVYTYGKYRSVNLGDFTWNQEAQLMCPVNPIGHVSLLLTPHHGINQSNSVALIHGLAPEVIIMHNSTRKGGALTTMQNVWSSPGLQDLWQIHWAYSAGLEYNAPGLFIANLEDPATTAGVINGTIPTGGGFGGGGRGGSGGGRGGSGGGRGAGRGPGGAPPAGFGGPGGPGGFGGPGGPGGPGGASGGRGAAAGHNGPAFYLKVSAHSDGSFTVTNTRNNFSKTYTPTK